MNKLLFYILIASTVFLTVGCDEVETYGKKFRLNSQDFIGIVSYLNQKHKINPRASGEFLPLIVEADEDETIKKFCDSYEIEYIAMTSCIAPQLNAVDNFFMFKIKDSNLFYSYEPCKTENAGQKIGQALQPHAVFKKTENLDNYKIPISMVEHKLLDSWFILAFKRK